MVKPLVDEAAINLAAERTRQHVRATPVFDLASTAFGMSGLLTLKLELMQHTGSFKPRGAFNRILAARVPESGVIAASGGNHGAAVAYAARALGYRAQIFVPAPTPAIKVERLKHYGAEVIVGGADYAEAYRASVECAAQTHALPVHAYDQLEVVAGQGTVARELEQQAPDLETVFVAVGGGGLIGGIAAWYAGRARVIAVEPERCPTLARALEAGQPVDVPVSGVAADSLGARRIGEIAFGVAREFVERVVLVSDEQIRNAQRALWDQIRVLAEPGGAAALAGLLCGQYKPRADERVGVIVCGGNTDPSAFGR